MPRRATRPVFAAVRVVQSGQLKLRLGERHTRFRTRCARCSRLSTVRFASGPKRSMGYLLGAEKIIFLIRDIDDATRAGASMESCRFVVLRSPGGRFWSVVDVGNRLQRMRAGFRRCIHISKVLCALLLWTMICQRFRSRALWGALRIGACGVGDHPTLDLS